MPKDKHFGPPPVTKAWLIEQFDKLHDEHKLILSKLGGGMISSDLEKALLKSAALAKGIDQKVPDKTVPPGSGPPPGSHWGPAPTKNFPQTKPPTSNERTFQ